MSAVELSNFFIDTVYPIDEEYEDIVVNDQEEPVGELTTPAKVQIVRYSVLALSAQDAIKRFVEDQAGVEVERTEATDFIIVGITEGKNPFG